MAVGQETASPGAQKATSAACPLSATLRLSPPQDLRHRLSVFPQPPFFVEYTMSSKCFLRAGKECTGTSPNPLKVENQEPQAPPCSENGSSLVSASIRGPLHR